MCSLDKIKIFDDNDDNFTNWMEQYMGPYVLCDKTNDEHSTSQSSEDCEPQNEDSGFTSEDESNLKSLLSKCVLDNEIESLKEKIELLQKISDLANKGINLTENYNIESDYEVMEWEYHLTITHYNQKNNATYPNDLRLIEYFFNNLPDKDEKLKKKFQQIKKVLMENGVEVPIQISPEQSKQIDIIFDNREIDNPTQINIEI